MRSGLTSRAGTLQWVLLAAFSCSAVQAEAADVRLAHIKGQFQQGDQLCWAATSAMAIDSFYTPPRLKVTQAELWVNATQGIWRDRIADLPAATRAPLEIKVNGCLANISDC